MSIVVADQNRGMVNLLTQIQNTYPNLIDSAVLETVARGEGRPVMPIRNGDVVIDGNGLWYDTVKAASAVLRRVIPSVGRIQVRNHPDFTWIGTGWLVDKDIVVTARHVADVFAQRTDGRYVFRSASQGVFRASVDFLQEVGRQDSLEMEVNEVLHIEETPGPDLSFLRVRLTRGELTPLSLSNRPPEPHDFVAVIGYNAYDSRIPDTALMERLFGKAWDKKQLSPGTVMAVKELTIEHDCSTTGGSGGAPLVDLKTGEAVGLNFAGKYLLANSAVPASVIRERLQGIQSGGSRGALPPVNLTLEQSSQYVGDDEWNWAVWIEGSDEQLDAVESVEYTLHPTFPKPVRLVQDRSTRFRLESSGWGTFLLRAKIRRKDGSVVPTSVNLDLKYPKGDAAASKR